MHAPASDPVRPARPHGFAFLACGIAFAVAGFSGQPAFIAIGAAFIALGIAPRVRAPRAPRH